MKRAALRQRPRPRGREQVDHEERTEDVNDDGRRPSQRPALAAGQDGDEDDHPEDEVGQRGLAEYDPEDEEAERHHAVVPGHREQQEHARRDAGRHDQFGVAARFLLPSVPTATARKASPTSRDGPSRNRVSVCP